MAEFGTSLGVLYDLLQDSRKAWVVYPNLSYREVKNLGYVIAHWKGLDTRKGHATFAWIFHTEQGYSEKGSLIVRFADGRYYGTPFASWQTFHERFIHRPVFAGLTVNVYHDDRKLGSFIAGQSFTHAGGTDLLRRLRREGIG